MGIDIWSQIQVRYRSDRFRNPYFVDIHAGERAVEETASPSDQEVVLSRVAGILEGTDENNPKTWVDIVSELDAMFTEPSYMGLLHPRLSILRRDYGTKALADYGLSKLHEQELIQMGMPLGTDRFSYWKSEAVTA